MVEFVDGAVIAQLSPPDMRLPIQYALYWPERRPGPTARFDWTQSQQFEFHPPDLDRFDALRLGFEVARMGGSGGAVLNAANEAAVAAFLPVNSVSIRSSPCAALYSNTTLSRHSPPWSRSSGSTRGRGEKSLAGSRAASGRCHQDGGATPTSDAGTGPPTPQQRTLHTRAVGR